MRSGSHDSQHADVLRITQHLPLLGRRAQQQHNISQGFKCFLETVARLSHRRLLGRVKRSSGDVSAALGSVEPSRCSRAPPFPFICLYLRSKNGSHTCTLTPVPWVFGDAAAKENGETLQKVRTYCAVVPWPARAPGASPGARSWVCPAPSPSASPSLLPSSPLGCKTRNRCLGSPCEK